LILNPLNSEHCPQRRRFFHRLGSSISSFPLPSAGPGCPSPRTLLPPRFDSILPLDVEASIWFGTRVVLKEPTVASAAILRLFASFPRRNKMDIRLKPQAHTSPALILVRGAVTSTVASARIPRTARKLLRVSKSVGISFFLMHLFAPEFFLMFVVAFFSGSTTFFFSQLILL